MTDIYTYRGTVTGMTCHHCVASVTEEVQELPGVQEVAVDLGSGSLVVHGSAPLDEEAVRTAVTEAGYALT